VQLLSWQILCGNFILPSGCAHVLIYWALFDFAKLIVPYRANDQ